MIKGILGVRSVMNLVDACGNAQINVAKMARVKIRQFIMHPLNSNIFDLWLVCISVWATILYWAKDWYQAAHHSCHIALDCNCIAFERARTHTKIYRSEKMHVQHNSDTYAEEVRDMMSPKWKGETGKEKKCIKFHIEQPNFFIPAIQMCAVLLNESHTTFLNDWRK